MKDADIQMKHCITVKKFQTNEKAKARKKLTIIHSEKMKIIIR